MVFDCSFDLTQPSAGAQQYAEPTFPAPSTPTSTRPERAKHGAPGATGTVTAHEADEPASGGRHPLPSRERFAIWLSSVGFANGMQAVVYDRNGANYCGRLWWMLKWAGHDAVAVLDGGLQAWQAAVALPAVPNPPGSSPTLSCVPLCASWPRGRCAGRTAATGPDPDRCAGRAPLPRRGRAAGPRGRAHSGRPQPPVWRQHRCRRPLQACCSAARRVRSPAGGPQPIHRGAPVRQRRERLPNMLAMEVAGLGKTTLFAGSWSEWCSDPSRPVERG
jgi:thiosulfate/3-mercaptopyruvate sulfurtransferase